VGVTGLEPNSASPSSANDLKKSAPAGGAKSGALGSQSGPIAPDLALVIDAWPTLPEAARRQVLGIVRTPDGTAEQQAKLPQKSKTS